MSNLQGWISVAQNDRERYLIQMASEATRIDELAPFIAKFGRMVWNESLSEWVNKAKSIRHSGTYGRTSVSMLYTIGRTVITLRRDGDNQITLLGYQDSVFYHTSEGNVVELADMLREVYRNWSIDNLAESDTLAII
jgi:hypothetical protein